MERLPVICQWYYKYFDIRLYNILNDLNCYLIWLFKSYSRNIFSECTETIYKHRFFSHYIY